LTSPPYLDTNNDGYVTALDALLVINYLDAHGPGPVPDSNAIGTSCVDQPVCLPAGQLPELEAVLESLVPDILGAGG
jgi:hypothetical protein